jgi:ATP-dependent helicase YprA (DUF1998 family)
MFHVTNLTTLTPGSGNPRDRSQPQREAALVQFRENEVAVLVATDAVARGIDVADVTHVIQFDLPISPKEFESYTHRIGRVVTFHVIVQCFPRRFQGKRLRSPWTG